MKTILVPTDFSDTATNAVNYAIDMAIAIGAGIHLLNIYESEYMYAEVPILLTTEQVGEASTESMARLKADILQRTDNKLHVDTEVRLGLFNVDLENICEDLEPYAVVMGSQGKTAAERFILGSHTVHAAKYLKWPLITVPPFVKFSGIKKIGLACDFDVIVDAMPIYEIKTLVNDFHAELQILNTGKPDVFDAAVIHRSNILREMLGDIKSNFHLLTGEDTDERILQFAELNHLDLLIVLPKRHSILGRLMHKSHTKQIVLHSHVPVIALHY